jgi:hypothetical protein
MKSIQMDITKKASSTKNLLTKQNMIYAGVAVILLVVVFWVVNGKGENKNNTTENVSGSSTESINQLGNDLKSDGTTWNVMSSESIGSELSPFDSTITDKTLTTEGKFLRIRIQVTNTTDKDFVLNDESFIIQDSENKQYFRSKDREIYINPDEVLKENILKAKETRVLGFIFEVPRGKGGFSFMTYDLSSTDRKLVPVALGI